MSREYKKRARAHQEEETRRRITEAAMTLHGSVGPARTTISAVAERAGVQRATVYRHFPDEAALFGACSSHWAALHPAPDPARWRQIADPGERLRAALGDVYAWYGSDEQMFVNVFRDAELVPGMQVPVEAQIRRFQEFVSELARGRRERGRARKRVVAAIAHALSFQTWQALTRQGGLADDEAVAIAAGMVAAAAGESPA
ncbi:MAG TPA: helix-turn-helix domain-containing protein [Thermoleophilaceae bacterium]|nr:helix-turn-helix domain-containing protein [Thermoleophilaceae bacterium]